MGSVSGDPGDYSLISIGNLANAGLYKVGEEPSFESSFLRQSSRLTGYLGIVHDPDFEDGAPDTEYAILLGGVANNGVVALGITPGVYSRTAQGPEGASPPPGQTLSLQAPSANNTSEVQMVGGTTPRPKVRASGVGVAFNGTAPIAKPTGVGVDAASIHAALVSLGLISA
jgi:hypothetical protein